MVILLNDREIEISPQSSLQALLQNQGFSDARGIAVAVNQKVISRQKWDSHILNQQDSILIIKATQGG